MLVEKRATPEQLGEMGHFRITRRLKTGLARSAFLGTFGAGNLQNIDPFYNPCVLSFPKSSSRYRSCERGHFEVSV